MALFGKLGTLTVNGTNTSAVDWPGGKGTFAAQGTWDSATMTLQMSVDNGSTYYSVGGAAALTDDSAVGFDLAPCKLRMHAAISGTTSVTGYVLRNRG